MAEHPGGVGQRREVRIALVDQQSSRCPCSTRFFGAEQAGALVAMQHIAAFGIDKVRRMDPDAAQSGMSRI